MDTLYQLLEWNPVQVGSTFQGGGVCIEKSIPRGRGGGVCIEKSIRRGGGGGGSELSDQLLDPDVPTLASQDKLKVSPKGLPFVNRGSAIGTWWPMSRQWIPDHNATGSCGRSNLKRLLKHQRSKIRLFLRVPICKGCLCVCVCF